MPATSQLIRYGFILLFSFLFLSHFLLFSTSPTYSSHLSAAKSKLGLISSDPQGGEVWYNGRRVNGKVTAKEEIKKGGRERINATFVTLARNRDLWELLSSMRGIEDRFNSRLGLNYDWVMLNDEPFSEEFKRHTTGVASGNVKFGLIDKEQWGDGFPKGINATLAQEKIDTVSTSK